jgi:hypothetical protein
MVHEEPDHVGACRTGLKGLLPICMQLLEPRPTPPRIMQASLYVRVCEPLADGAEERGMYNVVNRLACMLTLWQNNVVNRIQFSIATKTDSNHTPFVSSL